MLRSSLFVASVMMAHTCIAGDVSRCPADMVPIQIMVGTKNGPVTNLSAAKMSGSSQHFRAFVTEVTEHVAARLAKNKLCIDQAGSKKQSLLQFMSWPIIMRNMPPEPALTLDAQPTGGCRLSSPWMDIAFERKPTPSIRATVRWNERQLLADQALLAGAKNVPPDVALPLNQKEFIHYALDYASSEIRGKPAEKPVEERIPADLLWLFRHTWQSTLTPFPVTAMDSIDKAMKKGAKVYTRLAIALIDRCFDTGAAEIHYGSILDAADLIPLEQYKIDSLTY